MFINEILDGCQHLAKPQRKFLATFFSTMLLIQSNINFLSLSRHSPLDEKTYRRNFRKPFDFSEFNQQLITRTVVSKPIAFAMDASFIRKSGKHTFGLDKFWNGTHSRVERGLECSLISVIETEKNASLALSCEQTPPNLKTNQTRIDFYLAQLQRTAPDLPSSVAYGIVDGFYAKLKFVNGVLELGFHLISKLRSDANLKYLYEGPRNPRGRPRRFAGKVDFSDLSGFFETALKNQNIKLYASLVWSVTLKRKIKLVVVKIGKRVRHLFSTDLDLSAEKIFMLYRSRFSIEFLIRDAKQSAGLEDCQARDRKALEFHWNASFSSVNLARLKAQGETSENASKPFSMKSIKQQFFNEHLLKLFISNLGLEQTLIKYDDTLEKLRNFAVISP